MRLCEEYLARRGVEVEYAVHVRKGFVYFEGGSRLLAIRWEQAGPHPGFYEFSECSLESRCRVLRSDRVEWDDYESRLVEWKSSVGGVVADKGRIFDLTWQYFLRRHESDLIRLFPLSEIHATLDPSNRSRAVQCMGMLDSLARTLPRAAEFWHSRAFDIISLYCHWLVRL
jgi:hypothetical protein